ncbi:MAG: ion transporter [Mangrovicoccus sp.]
MRRQINSFLDGSHPRLGRTGSFLVNGFILVSAAAITLETLENLPLWTERLLHGFEVVILLVFTAEYLARLICAPHPLRYAFSFWGLVDLLACLPVLGLFSAQWAALRSVRVIRLVRLLKLLRASRAMERMEAALHAVRGDLAVFGIMAFIVLYIAAVGIYIFEHDAQPEAFSSIPESFWWAIVSFTTVGYGDAYPITAAGRVFTSAILFIGLGVIAVPAAVITSALIEHSRTERDRKERHDLSKHATRGHHSRPRPTHSDRSTGRR